VSISDIIKFPKYIYYFSRCFFLFKNPFSVIYHYIRRSTPRNKRIRLLNGIEIAFSDHPHDIITAFVLWARRDYGNIEKNSIVVDIGANIGVFSLYAVSMGARKVYAYEPSERAYEVLLHNIVHNQLEDKVVPHKLAVYNTSGDKVIIPIDSSPYNRMVTENSAQKWAMVGTVTLERIVQDSEEAFVDLLKIDCEGMEYDILFGATESAFSKIGAIRMEYHDGPIDDLIAHLKQHGFDLMRFDPYSATVWMNRP